MGVRRFDHDEIARLRQAGHSVPEIMEIVGCSSALVSQVLQSRGLTKKRTTTAPSRADELRPEILRHWEAGRTVSQIGKALGFYEEGVRRVLVAEGHDPTSRQAKRGRPAGAGMKMPQFKLAAIERAMEAEMTSRCAGCRAWRMTGTARDVIAAFAEHQQTCFARHSAAA
jgi:hypothetical protein